MRLAAAALLTLVLAAPARADDALDVRSPGFVSADAGVAAWTEDHGRLTLRFGDGPPVVTSLKLSPGRFDVGRAPDGGAQLVHVGDCPRAARRCPVRAIALTPEGPLRERTLITIPHTPGTSVPPVAVDGDDVIFGIGEQVHQRQADTECERLRAQSGDGPARVLAANACLGVFQLDVEDGLVAVASVTYDSYAETGVSLLDVAPLKGGPTRRIKALSNVYGTDGFFSVALDGGALYAGRVGPDEDSQFVRFDLRTRAAAQAQAFTRLDDYTRDGGRSLYAQAVCSPDMHDFFEDCSSAQTELVAGDDPWTVPDRLLAPQLRVGFVEDAVFVDGPATVRATLIRRRVGPQTPLAEEPVAGAEVQVRRVDAAVLERKHEVVATPVGPPLTTDASGTATLPLTAPFGSALAYDATTPAPLGRLALARDDEHVAAVEVHVSAAATRDAAGVVRVTGTLTPPLPGRRVALYRCYASRTSPCGVSSDSLPVARARVTADGAAFALGTVGARSGRYRVDVRTPESGPAVLAGHSAPFVLPR